jgi:hypothetical protein
VQDDGFEQSGDLIVVQDDGFERRGDPVVAVTELIP